MGRKRKLALPRTTRLSGSPLWTWAAGLLVVVSGEVGAQVAPPLVQVHGAWEGPYDWSAQLEFEPMTGGPCPGTEAIENELGHAMLLPSGLHSDKVFLWNFLDLSPSCSDYPTHRSWFFDPDNPGALIDLVEDPSDSVFTSNIFCSGQSFRPDGTILVAGGYQGFGGPVEQPVETYTFDPRVLEPVDQNGEIPWNAAIWTGPFPMAERRYYPTLMLLNRRTIEAKDDQLPVPQVTWTTPGSSHLVLGGISNTDDNVDFCKWFAAVGPTASSWSVPLVPDITLTNPPPVSKTYDRIDKDGVEVATGTEVSFTEISNYPRSLQLSNGDIVIAGHVPPGGASESWILRPPDPNAPPGEEADWKLHEGEDPGIVRTWSAAVLLHHLGPAAKDRILVFGGAKTSRLVQEFNPGSGAWVPKADMIHAREFVNAVILPTGKVFLVGGRSTLLDPALAPDGYNYEPEIYDPGPSSNSPTSSSPAYPRPRLPAYAAPKDYIPRIYHSMAVLLRDGRVLLCGGEDPSGGYPSAEFSGEVYKPPYFYQGLRPAIYSLARTASLWSATDGQGPVNFQATVRAFNEGIERVVLLRPAALTHHFDNDQRYIELPFSVPPGTDWSEAVTIDIQPPEDIYAPAGFYMLFVLDKKGSNLLPSIGEFIRIDA